MNALRLRASRALLLSAAGLVAAAGLAACGGSGSATVTPAAAATSAPAAGRPGFNSAEFQKIRQCLTAAGISLPTPSGGFRDRPSGSPGGTFTGPRPTGSGRPAAGLGREFSDPKIRAALAACGISLPTRRPTGAPTTAG